MSDLFVALLGGALLAVLVALGDLSRPVARLLCALDQHRWRYAAHAPQLRYCICCQRREHAPDRHPQPWDWKRS